MCMVDLNDEGWTVYHETKPRARYWHECAECGRRIEVGETYVAWTGLFDSYWSSGECCLHCHRAAHWLQVMCNGWLWHAILQDLEEHWDESWELRSMILGRLIVSMRKKWRRSNGTLMPLPDYVRGVKVPVMA